MSEASDPKKEEVVKEERPENVNTEPEKELFSWSAPTRITVKKSREFWVRGLATVSIFGLILFIVEGVMPVILLIAISFLVYVMATTEAEKAEYKITNKGIKISNNLNEWSKFTNYWITQRLGRKVLALGIITLPGRMEIIINEADEPKIKESMSKYLKEEALEASKLTSLSEWIYNKLVGM